MICKYCGTHLPDDAMFCANCGKAVGNRNKQKKSDTQTTLIVILIVIIVALIGGLAAFLIVRSSFPTSSGIDSMYTGATVSPEKTPEPTATPAMTLAPTVPPETQTMPPVPSEPPAVTGVNTNPGITEYMFESDKTLLTQSDLLKLTQAETRLLLNELYARHGYIFSTQEYRDYFMRKTWYTPKYTSQSDAEALFNGIERQNKVIITNYEQSMGWR